MKISWFVNIIRLLFGIFFLLGMLLDLYGIATDPLTYERVYTGAFLGEYRYDSLYDLKLARWRDCFIAMIYLLFVILHMTKFKQNKIFTWILRIMDISLMVFIGYSLYKTYCLIG
jgi:hypothetical protein